MYPFRKYAPFSASTIAIRLGAIVLVMGALCWHSESALAAASYSVTLQGSSQTSASPLRQSYWTATPGVAPTVINEEAAAAPGDVGAYARLDTAWPFEILAGISGNAGARAATDDFVITGPPGAKSVNGAMRFRTRIRLDRGGGLAGSDLHRARALLHVTAAQFQADGSCWFGNLDQGSNGVLAGHSPPLLEVSFSVPGAFPVGEPFAVSMNFEAEDRTLGDSTVSPGFTETDGLEMGMALGDEITIRHKVRVHKGHSFLAIRPIPRPGSEASSLLDADSAAFVRIFWNGADSITPSSRAEDRPFSRSSRWTILSMVSAS